MFRAFGFAGGANQISVAHGAFETIRLGSTPVGVAVLPCTVVCPALWGLGMLYVATGLTTRAQGPDPSSDEEPDDIPYDIAPPPAKKRNAIEGLFDIIIPFN